MLPVIRNSWALLLGITLLMMGNGIQGTLLGVRGELEGFSTSAMSIVMSGYFAGFLLGSQVVPPLIRRVGHVRVFAALGSLASAGLILYPALTQWISWTALRVLLGFCFCGVYIVAESWLNNTTTNATRGRALSLYVIAQMVGIVAAQAVFAAGDPGDYTLFIIVSVLVSLSFAPILLAATPVPPFETAKPLSLNDIYRASPLGCVGVLLMGAVFAGLYGMAGVYGAQSDLTVGQIAIFASAISAGGLILQYPLGWLSDRVDRRRLILIAAVISVFAALAGWLGIGGFWGLVAVIFIYGGMANPIYSMLLAYTNDYLEPDDMAAASARLLFLNGAAATVGPLVAGWLMQVAGPGGFFAYLGALMAALAGYAVWRMTQRPVVITTEGEEVPQFVGVAPMGTTPVTIGTVVEEWEEQIANEEEDSG
ncbi:MAG: MFS transporter [Pseudomonadota bacterium]